MNDKEHYVEIAMKAVKRAAHKVAEKAHQENRPLPIWRDGRIVFEVPSVSGKNNA
ncbi:MAG: hypothetical protein ACI8WB_003260 [Phenylobacterium sp.]|jgi:hypothetical protein